MLSFAGDNCLDMHADSQSFLISLPVNADKCINASGGSFIHSLNYSSSVCTVVVCTHPHCMPLPCHSIHSCRHSLHHSSLLLTFCYNLKQFSFFISAAVKLQSVVGICLLAHSIFIVFFLSLSFFLIILFHSFLLTSLRASVVRVCCSKV